MKAKQVIELRDKEEFVKLLIDVASDDRPKAEQDAKTHISLGHGCAWRRQLPACS